jgi:hypothetical protein
MHGHTVPVEDRLGDLVDRPGVSPRYFSAHRSEVQAGNSHEQILSRTAAKHVTRESAPDIYDSSHVPKLSLIESVQDKARSDAHATS